MRKPNPEWLRRPGRRFPILNNITISSSYIPRFPISNRSIISTSSLPNKPSRRATPGSGPKPVPKSTFINPNPDIRHIRLNPGLYSANCVDRNYRSLEQVPFQIADKFERWKRLQIEAKPLRDEAAKLRRTLAKDAYNSVKANSLEAAGQAMGPGGQPILTDAGRQERDVRQAGRDEVMHKARKTKAALEQYEVEEENLQAEMKQMALSLPNLSSVHTPVGTEPIVLEVFTPKEGKGVGRSGKGGVIRSHVQIGSDLDLIDFAGAAVTSGWGWYFLKNEAAMLEQGIIQYALEVAQQHGFRVVAPPSMVYSHIASAAGFQPRDQNGERQVYNVDQGGFDGVADEDGIEHLVRQHDDGDYDGNTNDTPTSSSSNFGMVLAGTAEIPLAGMRANTHLRISDLPDKVVGVSRCYRAEAGARGVDTRGLYRVHEFTKVELFGWAMPDEHDSSLSSGSYTPTTTTTTSSQADSTREVNPESTTRNGDTHFATTRVSHSSSLLDSIIAVQKHMLISLHLPFRVLEQPTADLGASATRKIDMEVLFPARARDAILGSSSSSSKSSSALPASTTTTAEDEGYGEVTSASTCGDYQSRRLGTKVRASPRPGQGVGTSVGSPAELLYVHTCNGTAAAIPRLLAALIENGWDESRQAVWIPEVLRRYVGGREWVESK